VKRKEKKILNTLFGRYTKFRDAFALFEVINELFITQVMLMLRAFSPSQVVQPPPEPEMPHVALALSTHTSTSIGVRVTSKYGGR
jgi:hypothetical protein